MSTEGLSFEMWLERGRLRRERLSTHQISVLEAAFRFLEHGGRDYALQPVLDRFNAAKHRLPWLDNRLLVLSFPAPTARAGPWLFNRPENRPKPHLVLVHVVGRSDD